MWIIFQSSPGDSTMEPGLINHSSQGLWMHKCDPQGNMVLFSKSFLMHRQSPGHSLEAEDKTCHFLQMMCRNIHGGQKKNLPRSCGL